MIKMVRLDERMIHGQIAIKWSRHLSVDRIVVVSDEAASNPIVEKSLLMAAPTTVKTAVKGTEDALALLNDPRMDTVKVLVIVSSPEDLLRVVTEVKGIPLVNVGNYGRIASKKGDEPRKAYRANLYAYDDEVQVLKKVMDTGINCIYQTTPEEAPESLKNALGL